jgi:chaperone LolA
MRLIASAMLMLAAALPAQAGDAARLQKLETYLNGLKTFRADFVQTDPQGNVAEGEVFLHRPGTMRWNYLTPAPVVMITRGDTLLYYDQKMDEVSYLPLDDVAAAMLIQANVDLDSDEFKVLSLEEEAGITRLSMQQADDPAAGTFTLTFRDVPMQLYGIELNQQGQITSMALQNIKQNLPLPDKTFDFKNPRGVTDPTKK